MNKYLMIFISAFTSGLCICFGASVYLLCQTNGFAMKVVGSLMFGIGLFTIIHAKLWLYTGKVGFVIDNKPKYLLDLIICFIGNALGCFLLSLILKQTRIGDNLREAAIPIVDAKINDTWYSIFILSIMCGVMIYLAVVGHKKCEYPLGKVLFVFLPVSLFILCSFEHVVANIVYFTYAGEISFKVVGYFIIMFIGNAIGSITFDLLLKLINYFENKNNKENIIEEEKAVD